VTQAAKVHPSAKSFVDPRVRETKVTSEIINKIYGFFPLSSKLISGYLDEEQLYWKVNYHWEYLLEMIEHSEKLPLDDKFTKALHAIKNVLESNKPDPARGYRLSNVPGLPKDKSSHALILARHKLVSQSKRDFKRVVEAADLKSKSKRSPKSFGLACAPVAAPGKGKHSTGYAVDIKGNNDEIARIARNLGASLVFPEDSHVHVEFKNGVIVPGTSNVGVQQGRQGAAMKVQSNQQHAIHRYQ